MKKSNKLPKVEFIIPQAYQYLQTLWQNRNGKSNFAEYVLPELAQMYLHNRSSVP